MRTQLLEDIGESATLFRVPSGRVADTTSHQVGPDIAQAPAAAPATPGSNYAPRHRPASEPAVIATQQDEASPPVEIPQPPSEPVAAVEAQHIPPYQVHEPAISPAEFMFAAQAMQSNPRRKTLGFILRRPGRQCQHLSGSGVNQAGSSDRGGAICCGACACFQRRSLSRLVR